MKTTPDAQWGIKFSQGQVVMFKDSATEETQVTVEAILSCRDGLVVYRVRDFENNAGFAADQHNLKARR